MLESEYVHAIRPNVALKPHIANFGSIAIWSIKYASGGKGCTIIGSGV
jgi:hypothetical protein